MHHHMPLRNKIVVMASVMASLFLVALDQTIISTALGKIVEEFNAFSSLSLVVTAYLLTTTVTVPIAGKLSDLFGRRIMLLVGVFIFAVGSLFSGAAGSIEMLIFARAFQGIGGGIITANAFTIIGDLFSPRERGRWQGFIGAVFGFSSLIGPLLGGYLTDGSMFFGLTTDWRWTFYINVPIAIIAFIVIAIYCPRLKHDKKPRVDYYGASLLVVALATLVLAVDNTETVFQGLLESTSLSLAGLRAILLSIAALATVGFVALERRAEEPILPLYFFRNRNFTKIMAIATLFGAAFLGAILYLTQFNQQVFGASPTESGLMLLPMIGGLMATSIIGGQVISRTGKYKIFMQTGIVVATVAMLMLVMLVPESSYVTEAFIILFLGMGLGIVMPVLTLAVQNEFSQKELGVATSSSQLFRSLGSTIGVAMFGALLTGGITTALGPNIQQDDAYLRMLAGSEQIQSIGSLDNSDTLLTLNTVDVKRQISDGFTAQTEQLPAEQREQQQQVFFDAQAEYSSKVTHAFSDSLHKVFILAAVLMATGAVFVFALEERKLRGGPDDAPGVA